MSHEEVCLSPTDEAILNSYRNLVSGLESYLGAGYEIVLHSLASMEHSVIAIANGHHTGRKEGSPITDLALQMLFSIEQEKSVGHESYFTTNKNGEPLKSSTIVIYGENHRAIGLLCMNFYLNTPISQVISSLFDPSAAGRSFLAETFADNTEELVHRVTEKIRKEVETDSSILPSLKNKEIIQRCNARGVFQIKNAVNTVATLLGISKNTVYLHLKSI